MFLDWGNRYSYKYVCVIAENELHGVLDARRARDRDHPFALRQEPGQGDLSGGRAQGGRHGPELAEQARARPVIVGGRRGE